MKRELVSTSVLNRAVAAIFCICLPPIVAGVGNQQYVERAAHAGSFRVAAGGHCAPIVIDAGEYAGVVRAANDLKADVNRVTGCTPEMGSEHAGGTVILVGTLGKSKAIDELARAGKIDVGTSQANGNRSLYKRCSIRCPASPARW